MNNRRGSAQPSRRIRTTGDSRPNLLVFSEGKVTEAQYVIDWYRRNRERVTVEIDDYHGTPFELVKRAVATKKSEHREEKRGRGRAHTHYWCIFDRDEHPYVPEAFALAEAHQIHTAFSDPCLELWFLLHFQDQTAGLHRHEVQRLARKYLGCDKNLTVDGLRLLAEETRFAAAKDRAVKLDAKHQGDGSPARSNPSSSVWTLMELIRNGR